MGSSIKKKFATHIYYGVDCKTGAMRYIDDVPSGRQCNCICSACGQPLEAKKGEQNRHHFAHVSNYDCMYASEIAVYKALVGELEREKKLCLPPVTLQFPTWPRAESVRKERVLAIDSVIFHCEPYQYPPDLMVSIGDSRLRLILGFGGYYRETDLQKFQEEARQEGYSVLLIEVERITSPMAFAPDKLRDIIMTAEDPRHWVRSTLEDRCRERLLQETIVPQSIEGGVLCAAHVREVNGQYVAMPSDCRSCRFNFAKPPECRCAAEAGIQCYEDYKRSKDKRNVHMEVIRRKNEKRFRDQEQLRREKEMLRQIRTMPPVHRAVGEIPKRPKPSEEELRQEEQRIKQSFDAASQEWNVDRFHRRWIQCTECGAIKMDTEMTSYGGRQGPNLGICRTCTRAKRSL